MNVASNSVPSQKPTGSFECARAARAVTTSVRLILSASAFSCREWGVVVLRSVPLAFHSVCIVFAKKSFGIVWKLVSRAASEIRVGMGEVAKEDLKWCCSIFCAVHVEIYGRCVYYG